MRRFPLAVLFACLLVLASSLPAAARTPPTCTEFTSWEWAQSVFESDPQKYDALDPDTNGLACEDLPKGGFAPAFWTDSIPEDVQEAELVRIIDGDTFEVLIGGVSNRIRIYRADTPETQNEKHCGGQQATDFATKVFSLNDNPIIYIEKDKNERDRYGRELGYIWLEVDGEPYMLNHVLINSGYAEDVDYGDRKYDVQIDAAAAFARRHELGVWGLCGGFDIPATPVLQSTEALVVQSPSPAQAQPAADGSCDPNYTPCIPAYPPDLDCGQIGISVTVTGSDPHRLDTDNDRLGCESY